MWGLEVPQRGIERKLLGSNTNDVLLEGGAFDLPMNPAVFHKSSGLVAYTSYVPSYVTCKAMNNSVAMEGESVFFDHTRPI